MNTQQCSFLSTVKNSYLTETIETAITKLRTAAPSTVPTIIRMSSVSEGEKKIKQETCQLITHSEY